MSVTPLNHATLAASRLTGLYQDKVKWKAFVAMVASCFDDLEAVLARIIPLDNIDVPFLEGILLDTLGARVGQARRISQALPVMLFGWDDDTDALGWSEDDPAGLTGGSWHEDGAPLYADAIMDDATYRTAIRMRILKNRTKVVNLETLITSTLYLFPDLLTLGTYALVLTEYTGTVVLGIGRVPTQLEVGLLRYTGAFPKPAGISLGGYWWTAGTPTFAFDDDPDPDAAGWFEEGSPSSGGTFAEEF